MKIAQKNTKGHRLKSNISLAVGVGLLLFTYFSTINSDSFFAFFIIGAFFLMGLGVYFITLASDCKMETSHTLNITNGRLIFDARTYSLNTATLLVKLSPCGKSNEVSLFLTKQSSSMIIFNNIMMDAKEYKAFLDLIKPYKKTTLCHSATYDQHHYCLQGGVYV